MSEISDCLKAARDKVEADWHKHAYQQGDSHCGVSAITDTDAAPAVKVLAIKHMNRLAPGGKLSAYNDRKDTTHEDILMLFDSAIEMLSDQPIAETVEVATISDLEVATELMSV